MYFHLEDDIFRIHENKTFSSKSSFYVEIHI